MPLSDAQNTFTQAMFAPVDVVNEPNNSLQSLFVNDGEIPLSRRLKIYRNHIVATLSDVLVMTFPFVKALTGEDFLTETAKYYLLQNPPREACLDRYGIGFADFLENYKAIKDYPYLPDAARLDWLMNEARCAKDDSTLQASDLSAIAPEEYLQTVFKLKNCVKIMRSDFPLDKIYDFCTNEDDIDTKTLDITGPETFLLVTRVGWEPHIIRLDAAEFFMFQNLQQEVSLETALEAVLENYPDFDFAAFLQNYIGLETFSSFDTNS